MYITKILLEVTSAKEKPVSHFCSVCIVKMPRKVGIMTTAALVWKSPQASCWHCWLQRCQVTPNYRRSHFLLISPNCMFSTAPKSALFLQDWWVFHCFLLSGLRRKSMCPFKEAMSKGSPSASIPGEEVGQQTREDVKVQGICGYTNKEKPSEKL